MTRKNSRPKADAHQIVTDAVISFLEACEAAKENGEKIDAKWNRPWEKLLADGHYCPATKRAYEGFVNAISLNALALDRGFTSEAWGTFKQWLSLGTDDKPVCVRKGSKAAYIFVPIVYKKKDGSGNVVTDSNGDEVKGLSFKQVPVFNADDVEGYEEAKPELPENKVVNNSAIDAYLENVGVDFSHGGNRAYYSPAGDHIRMPVPEAFKDVDDSTATEGYYATKFHENIHATGHDSRCKRDLSGGFFGNAKYAYEELVAEMGAAILCNLHGVSSQPREDHAKYIKSWLKGLKGDKGAVFKAVAAAQKAIRWMDAQQPGGGK